MKKLFFLAISLTLTCNWLTSCRDTESYADLVDAEKSYISQFIENDPYKVNFGNVITWDEDELKKNSKKVLTDSIHPSTFMELNQWYTISEGDFKRLYFCVHSWGNDGVTDYNNAEQLQNAFRNKKKFNTSQNIMVRYDSLFLLNTFDYNDLNNNMRGNNLDAISYLICYNWNTSYYSTSSYAYYYGSSSNYTCTSGGLGFPIRFLWEGGEVAIICPFSLVDTNYSSAYYTLYYGHIEYSRPTFLPQ